MLGSLTCTPFSLCSQAAGLPPAESSAGPCVRSHRNVFVSVSNSARWSHAGGDLAISELAYEPESPPQATMLHPLSAHSLHTPLSCCRAVAARYRPALAHCLLLFLCASSGLFAASTAMLPSSFTMYALTAAAAGMLEGRPYAVILAAAVGGCAVLSPSDLHKSVRARGKNVANVPKRRRHTGQLTARRGWCLAWPATAPCTSRCCCVLAHPTDHQHARCTLQAWFGVGALPVLPFCPTPSGCWRRRPCCVPWAGWRFVWPARWDRWCWWTGICMAPGR